MNRHTWTRCGLWERAAGRSERTCETRACARRGMCSCLAQTLLVLLPRRGAAHRVPLPPHGVPMPARRPQLCRTTHTAPEPDTLGLQDDSHCCDVMLWGPPNVSLQLLPLKPTCLHLPLHSTGAPPHLHVFIHVHIIHFIRSSLPPTCRHLPLRLHASTTRSVSRARGQLRASTTPHSPASPSPSPCPSCPCF